MPGLSRLVEHVGVRRDAAAPVVASAIDYLLEGLYSLKKISRSEDRGYQAADTPRRSSGRSSEPLFDQGVPVPGKKKYYN